MNKKFDNYAYVPASWHSFAGSSNPAEKINLTRFHKMVYDHIDARGLTYYFNRRGRMVKLDDHLSSLFRVDHIDLEEIQDRIAYLVSLVVKVPDDGVVHVYPRCREEVRSRQGKDDGS